MNKIKLILGASLLLLSGQVGASIINISYELDFTSHVSNEGWHWITNEHEYNNEDTINNYLDKKFEMLVQYDTSKPALRYDSSGNLYPENHPALEWYNAKIVSTDLILNSEYFLNHEYAYDDLDPDDTWDIHFTTTLLNFLSMASTDRSKVTDLEVDDVLTLFMIDQGDIQYEYQYGFQDIYSQFGETHDMYMGAATILDIQPVPEPSIIALFAAGLFGLGFVRRRQA